MTVDLNAIYKSMASGEIKIVMLSGVTGGTGLPANYYTYSSVLIVKSSSNYGIMIMLSLSYPTIMFTRLMTGESGDWYQTARTKDA